MQRLKPRKTFALATLEERFGRHSADLRRVDAMVAAGDISAFPDLVRVAWESKERTDSGERLYRLLLNRVAYKPEWDDTSYIAMLRRLHASQPSAMTAAILANAYVTFAWRARGTGWAREVNFAQWAEFEEWHERGLELLAEFADEGQHDVVWMDTLDTALQTRSMSAAEYLAHHEQMWSMDRGDFVLLLNAGQMLLPRWHGAGPEDVEAFARNARDVTYGEFGEGGYALVHASFIGVGELEPSDTIADADRIAHGFRDLTARFPGIRMQNRAVATLGWLQHWTELKRYFDSGFRVLDPDAWGVDDEAAGEWATRAYLFSQKHG